MRLCALARQSDFFTSSDLTLTGAAQNLALKKTTHADPVKVDSKHYTVEFENDQAPVLRIKYGRKLC